MPVVSNPVATHPRLDRSFPVLGGGATLVGVGVGLLILAGYGVGPFDVLTTGLARATDWPLGVAVTVVSATVVALAALLGRRPRLGTLLSFLLVSASINATVALVPEATIPALAIPQALGGFALLVAGVALVIGSRCGESAPELLMLALVSRGLPLIPLRIGLDVLCVLCGALLGGRVGVATLLIALTFSRCLAWALRLIRVPAATWSPPVRVLTTPI